MDITHVISALVGFVFGALAMYKLVLSFAPEEEEPAVLPLEEPVEALQVAEPGPEPEPEPDTRTESVEQALSSLGFKKKDARDFALKAIEMTPGKTEEDAVVLALRLSKGAS